MRLPAFLLCLLALSLSACRSPAPQQGSQSSESLSLLEERLLETIEMEARLEEEAAMPGADKREIQRLFQRVAREYEGIIARNPDNLESRLLYGKLLMRYGDGTGARNQFLNAARIEPDVAVIHQQLSTFYAEERDYTRALAYALNAIEIEPETAIYHFGLGQLLAAFREEFITEQVFTGYKLDSEMLKSFKTACELEPDTLPFQFRYGEAFYDVDGPDWQLALEHWEFLSVHPGLTQLQQDAVRLHQARCLVELGQTKAAQEKIDAVKSPELQPSAAAILTPES
ncbi:tetratricopeptide repeat protein [Puniceicoccales bacterium CK1056]|uniref:Tetratricopeptide repeat protein n=1 Tax=Oceanipulchritudo coccoides TaxID=2706888 RepID=A0A6B2M0V9_9BACT|nr:tetratricopeptide repeat protein [Oceanipulchritudo coccoides]NDV61959.1 tetratricopeptide repeat protein [Oceanipulchritudo coccoides]